VTILEYSTCGVLLVWLYAFIVLRWQRGLYLLIAYLPFAGAVSLALGMWRPSLLFKDVLFVAPLYAAFFSELSLGRSSLRHFPQLITFFMTGLTVLALAQSLSSGVSNRMMALIGLKVWLCYLPLAFVAYAYAESPANVLKLFRLLVVLSFVPGVVGMLQVAMVGHFGYRTAMELSYGDLAPQTTQGFTYFDVGNGSFGRIPSLFTFPAQFFGFSLSMLVPAYATFRSDPVKRWRRVGGCAMAAAIVAAFISGIRAAFIFIPMVLALILLLDQGVSGLVGAIGGSLLLGWAAVTGLFGIALWEMYSFVAALFSHYAGEVAYGGLVQALETAPLGMGTGTNTGAARYALTDPTTLVGIENYYAKAVYELGLPGLVVVAGLFLGVIVLGLKTLTEARIPDTRCWASAIVAFAIVMCLNSFKGWLIELDPVNVYYWIFCGLLLKLPALQPQIFECSRAADLCSPRAVA
jgi:hypothetical protein